MLTVEEVEMKRVRREEHFSKTRTFKKQKKIRKKVKILKYYFFTFCVAIKVPYGSTVISEKFWEI